MTLPVPPHSGQGLPSICPVPLQARQMFSPVCDSPGDASSPGFLAPVSVLGIGCFSWLPLITCPPSYSADSLVPKMLGTSPTSAPGLNLYAPTVISLPSQGFGSG